MAPLALVRCSRGGKTRGLSEIAKMIQDQSLAKCVLSITFNDYSSLSEDDQEDPLSAILWRIAYVASKGFRPEPKGYRKFREKYKDFHLGKQDIIDWMGNHKAVLLIDELNNLKVIREQKSEERMNHRITQFGDFLKEEFLDQEGRFLVFSSHVLYAAEHFVEYVDPGQGSLRTVILQALPLFRDLKTAQAIKQGVGAREVIYLGCMPSMLHASTQHAENIEGKRQPAVTSFLKRPKYEHGG